MENKRSKKPSGAQFRKRRRRKEMDWTKDKGMHYSVMSYYACNETDSNSLI